jgi:purine-cytosine permease-like protein
MVFGTTFRAVITAFVSIPFVIVLGMVLEAVVPMYKTNHWLADAMLGVGENALTVVVLGCLMMVIARSVTSSRIRYRD